jgi:hypothetical protein
VLKTLKQQSKVFEWIMMTTRIDIEFEDREGWRYWLQEHHASQKESWLVLFKKGQGVGLSLDEAVEEALCFGWIDGKLNPLDERRYALRFSPRKADSVWSISNIQRVERLAAEGKMTPAGHMYILLILREEHPTFKPVNPTTWIKNTDYRHLEFYPSMLAKAAQRQHPTPISF